MSYQNFADNSSAPIGSDAVERALTELHVAAVAFTAQVAISEGHDSKAWRRIETKLIAMFACQGAS